MTALRTCGACDSTFIAPTAQTRFCPSCAGSRRYDAQVRMRLKKATGSEFPPHCARCGADTIRGHSYCLSCATIRRLDLKANHERDRRLQIAETDFEAQNQRRR